jgi:hypothetical protein
VVDSLSSLPTFCIIFAGTPATTTLLGKPSWHNKNNFDQEMKFTIKYSDSMCLFRLPSFYDSLQSRASWCACSTSIVVPVQYASTLNNDLSVAVRLQNQMMIFYQSTEKWRQFPSKKTDRNLLSSFAIDMLPSHIYLVCRICVRITIIMN